MKDIERGVVELCIDLEYLHDSTIMIERELKRSCLDMGPDYFFFASGEVVSRKCRPCCGGLAADLGMFSGIGAHPHTMVVFDL